jgi:hypothetical protein
MNLIFYIFKCLDNTSPLISKYFLSLDNLSFFLLNQGQFFAPRIPYKKPRPRIVYSVPWKNVFTIEIVKKYNIANDHVKTMYF